MVLIQCGNLKWNKNQSKKNAVEEKTTAIL